MKTTAQKVLDAETPKPADGLVRVVLVADHTHAGKQYKAGDPIEVTTATADWLKGAQVI